MAFIGEIRLFAFDWAPMGWALCNGQSLPKSQNSALFYLIGYTYGGQGNVFNLPDLRGRAISGVDKSNQQSVPGFTYGSEAIGLSVDQMPMHSHTLVTPSNEMPMASNTNGLNRTPSVGNSTLASLFLPIGVANVFYNNSTPDVALNIGSPPVSLGNTGKGLPVDVMQPFLVLNFCICTQGIFPQSSEQP
jgi:microcystin-dependent protein